MLKMEESTTATTTNDDQNQNKRQKADPTIQLLCQQKQSLRKHIRSKIKSTYPKNEPSSTIKLNTQSNLVFARLFNLPQYAAASSIGFFLSMPHSEVQTHEAIRHIVKDGKSLYVPRV